MSVVIHNKRPLQKGWQNSVSNLHFHVNANCRNHMCDNKYQQNQLFIHKHILAVQSYMMILLLLLLLGDELLI